MQIRAGQLCLVQLRHDALPLRFAEKISILFLRAVAPKDIFRLGSLPDFLHPIKDRLIRRLGVSDSARRMNGGGDVIHIWRGSKVRGRGWRRTVILDAWSTSPSKFSGTCDPAAALLPKDGACTDEWRAV